MKCDLQQQTNKLSKSFDQTSESEKNNHGDDSFYDWDDNNNKENININRVSSEIQKVNNFEEEQCDGGFHESREDKTIGEDRTPEENKVDEEDKYGKQRINQYELRKAEQSLISEYVVASSLKEQSSSEQISDGQNINNNGEKQEQPQVIRNVVGMIDTSINGQQNIDNQNGVQFSSQFYSSEIRALQFQREQEIRKPVNTFIDYFQTDLVQYCLNDKIFKLLIQVNLNVIIIGKSGIGKSTFIDAFLDQKFQKQTENIRPTTKDIIENKAVRQEGDTPGYEENQDLTQWKQQLVSYITSKVKYINLYSSQIQFLHVYLQLKFDQYKEEEKKQLQKSRRNSTQEIIDNRINCCLYFLNGPRMSQIDIDNLLLFQNYTSIIPILARGDTYTNEEVKEIKKQLKKDAEKYKIQWFDSEIFKDQPEKYNKFQKSPFGPVPPFVIISSIKKIKINDKETIYGRQYNWGICDIKNPEHSDFTLLYNSLIGMYSVNLVKLTKAYYIDYQKQLKELKALKTEKKYKEKQGILAGFAGIALSAIGFFAIKKLGKN